MDMYWVWVDICCMDNDAWLIWVVVAWLLLTSSDNVIFNILFCKYGRYHVYLVVMRYMPLLIHVLCFHWLLYHFQTMPTVCKHEFHITEYCILLVLHDVGCWFSMIFICCLILRYMSLLWLLKLWVCMLLALALLVSNYVWTCMKICSLNSDLICVLVWVDCIADSVSPLSRS